MATICDEFLRPRAWWSPAWGSGGGGRAGPGDRNRAWKHESGFNTEIPKINKLNPDTSLVTRGKAGG